MRVDGKRIASACRNNGTARVSTLRVTIVSDPLGFATPHEKPSHLTMVTIIMHLLERDFLGPRIGVANEIHAFVCRWLADIQQEWGDSHNVCAMQVKLIERIVVKRIFTRQPFAGAPLAPVCLVISSSTWCVVIKVKGFRVSTPAVSSSENPCALRTSWQLHYPTCATYAQHERGL